MEKYIGIPFKEKGSSLEGCDCWGLVRLFYENEFGIKLTDFSDLYENTDDSVNIPKIAMQESKKWKKVEIPQFGDVILVNIHNLPLHVGIFIDQKYMLHVLRGTNSVLEKHNSIHWQKRIEGVYRYE